MEGKGGERVTRGSVCVQTGYDFPASIRSTAGPAYGTYGLIGIRTALYL